MMNKNLIRKMIFTILLCGLFVAICGKESYAAGWSEDESGNKIYVAANGNRLTGKQIVDGANYYFDANGVMQTGIVVIDGAKYYFSASGMARKGLVTDGEKMYYSEEDGKLRTGWLKSSDGIYYLLPSDCSMAKGWTKIDDNVHYFGEDGKALSGWNEIDGKKYFLGKRGKKFTGFTKVKGKRYFLLKDGGYQIGWKKKGSNKYYFDDNGVMATGWKRMGGYKYYFYKSGNSAGKPIGAMAKNVTIDGKKIDKKGRAEGSRPDDMDKKANGFSSATGYLILVNCSTHNVAIYSGGKGCWTPVHKWQCADGAPGSPTVKGEFSTGSKGYYFDSYGVRCFYYTQFSGNYLFHSVLCNENGDVVDGRVGMALSHGCVRLAKDNAKWIYDNIPTGTKVVVY